MRKQLRTLLMGALLLSVHTTDAQKKTIKCNWHSDSILHSDNLSYRAAGEVFYNLSNNDDYLIINLLISGDEEQKKVLLFGLSIYVDPNGKTNKDLLIMYPYRRRGKKYRPANADEDIADFPFKRSGTGTPGDGTRTKEGSAPRRAIAGFDEIKHDLADRYKIIALKGYSDTADVIAIPANNSTEVRGWMSFNSRDNLRYTLIIPLDKLASGKSKTKGISLGFESGYFNPAEMESARGGGQGGRSGRGAGGGQGGRSGGGQGGGGGGQGSGPGGQQMSPGQRTELMEQLQDLSIPLKFWLKNIVLAEKK